MPAIGITGGISTGKTTFVNCLRELLPEGVHIQVDGGVGPDNASEAREAGANLQVAGTSIFGREDIAEAYRGLAQAIS